MYATMYWWCETHDECIDLLNEGQNWSMTHQKIVTPRLSHPTDVSKWLGHEIRPQPEPLPSEDMKSQRSCVSVPVRVSFIVFLWLLLLLVCIVLWCVLFLNLGCCQFVFNVFDKMPQRSLNDGDVLLSKNLTRVAANKKYYF